MDYKEKLAESLSKLSEALAKLSAQTEQSTSAQTKDGELVEVKSDLLQASAKSG